MKKPGKGKKRCPECQEICGASSKKCINSNCTHSFEKAKKQTPEPVGPRKILIPPGYTHHTIRYTVVAPAGYCPFDFPKKINQDTINEWVYSVREHHLKRDGAWLLNKAIKYYLNYEYNYDYKCKEYVYAAALIDNIQDIEFVSIENNLAGEDT